MLMHVWKSLPFWTLILIAGRLAIPSEQYEAASVDGATHYQKFRFITWPSLRTLYVTSLILSMIWTLGDFQQRLSADRRRTRRPNARPGHARHPLSAPRPGGAVMAFRRRGVAARAAARLFHDEEAFQMKPKTWKAVSTEAKLLLIGIPLFLWTMIPIYHLFLFAISTKDSATSGRLWPKSQRCRTSRSCLARSTSTSTTSGSSSPTRC